MKHLLVIFCLLFPVVVSGAQKESLEEVLRELDRTIQERDFFVEQKEHTLDSLKLQLKAAQTPQRQYALFNELFDAYKKFQMDSALYYVYQEERLLAKYPTVGDPNDIRMNRAEVMSIMGMYKEAVQTLDAIPRDSINTQDQLINYYHQYRTVYGYMADYALTKPEKDDYIQKTNAYRDSLLFMEQQTGRKTYLLVETDKHIVEHQYEKALKEIATLYDDPEIPRRLKGLLAYNFAEAYKRLGDHENYKYYLAVSAITDLQLCIREYVALPKLALAMFEEEDIYRAYDYLQCSMSDAVACNARLRTIEATNIYPIIDQTYKAREERSNRIQLGLLLGITLLSLFLALAIFYVKSQMRKLAEARRALSDMNRKLSEANAELSELNTIKQQYITYYLEQCTMYLDKLEEYRRSLAKLAITSKINELFKAIKSERFIEEERIKFYKSFDETFLNLYPHFVEQFNELLADGEKIYPKPGELLCTEIRIFALIRLGISDSNKIARFLRYSINTIYIYRSKVRNKAKGDKAEFEQEVMKIE